MLTREPVLLATQKRFAAALRDATKEEFALADLRGDSQRNQALIEIYRGNAVSNTATALRLAYPVVSMLVGDEFFAALAREFWRDTPPKSGDLNGYGAGFGDFLAAFPPASDLGYLPDVARLEWLVHRAYGAAQLAPADLAAVEQAATGADVFHLSVQPSLGVIRSDWPVATIWLAHQSEAPDCSGINLSASESALVSRGAKAVGVVPLSACEAAFWQACIDGKCLDAALEQALDDSPDFDLVACLQAGFSAGWVASNCA